MSRHLFYGIIVSVALALVPATNAWSYSYIVSGSGVLVPVYPKISITPDKGPADMVVTIKGEHFGQNSKITIKYDGIIQSISPAPITDNNGAFATQIKIPQSGFGQHEIRAIDGGGHWDVETYEVQKPFLTISPPKGPSGTEVTTTGKNFPPNSVATIRYVGLDRHVLAFAPIDAQGTFIYKFSIPRSAPGGNVIAVTDSRGNNFNATFVVLGPSISLSTSSGVKGDTIRVSGSLFASQSPITIMFDNIISNSQTKIITDSKGSFSATIAIPASSVGIHTIGAKDRPGNSASTQFQIKYQSTTAISPKILGIKTIRQGTTMLFNATVTGALGNAIPTGTVAWAVHGGGALSVSKCTLSPMPIKEGKPSYAMCTVKYTAPTMSISPQRTIDITITAKYSGDSIYGSSSDSVMYKVSSY